MDIVAALKQAQEFRQRSLWTEAKNVYDQLLRLHPNVPEIHNELATFYYQQRRVQESIPHYRRALELRPQMVAVLNNLGVALHSLRQFDDAARCFQQGIQQHPEMPDLHNNLGNVFHAQGRYQEAAECYQQALKRRAEYPEAWTNLGNALVGLRLYEPAIKIYQTALKLVPQSAETHFNLGNAYRHLGRLTEAAGEFEIALKLNPQYANAWQNLGVVRKLQGQLLAAIECFENSVRYQPNDWERASNLLFCSQFLPGEADTNADRPSLPNSELLRRHQLWAAQFAAPLTSKCTPKKRTEPERRTLRIGFVSPDLHHHPVGLFLIRTLEHLPRDEFEIACYSDCTAPDQYTTRFKARATIWQDTFGWSDEAVAAKIAADDLDVLIDLAGHTKGGRPLVLARRPARVQCTYIGYPGTTGSLAIDYLLIDQWHLPVGNEASMASERILRLPGAPFCYEPPQQEISVGPLPAASTGFITFGSFNNPAKFNDRVIGVWSEILQRIPNSRLVLKYRGLNDPSSTDWFRNAFGRRGISADRLEFQGFVPFQRMLEEYQRIDIALDPFPFTGGLTSLIALWMGLPIVTCPGESFASRQTMSYLKWIEFEAGVATSLDDYVSVAVRMTQDLNQLAAWRRELRSKLLASPLCDAATFAGQFAGVLREISS